MTRTASAHGLTSPRPTDWRDLGACLGEDPELWFALDTTTVGSLDVERAKTICNRCPARQACLDFALTNRITIGIFGGLTEDERHNLNRRQGRHARRPVQNPRGPKQPPPATLRELFDRHTEPQTSGHLMWTGTKTPEFQRRQLTVYQLSYLVDRGHEWDGTIRRMCEVRGCVQPLHLADEQELAQKKAAV